MYNRKNVCSGVLVLFEKYYYFFIFLIFLMAFFNVFYNLGNVPIDSWDEARHGISAYEMLKNEDYIVNTFAFETDYWNLKPPISFWSIMLGYKLAGFNPLGLRIFSAVAALITILSVAFFTKYKHGKLASILSALVLATTAQYILSHCARTGDADSLHVLFFTLAVISAALIEKNRHWLYSAGFFFSLSFLTKSWHALSILAIIGIYLLVSKTFLKIRFIEWLLFLAASFSPILIWGWMRYSKDGLDFFQMMISYDLLSRTATTLEGHIGEASYYLLTLEQGWNYWAVLLVGSLVILLYFIQGGLNKSARNYVLLLGIWISVPLVFYSIARTKIIWYILPIYPALSICAGAASAKILYSLNIKTALKILLVLGFIFSGYNNEKLIQKEISQIPSDPLQATIQNIRHLKDTGYTNIYTLCGPIEYASCWRQSDLLAAELYGDLIPHNGGLESFLQDKEKSLILLPKKNSEMLKSKKYNLIYENAFVTIWSNK